MSVKSIREIKEELKQIPPERLPEYLMGEKACRTF